MRTLYLEDNMNDARLMSLYFATTPHSLHHVLNVQEAEELITHDSNFDLLLIDIMLRQSREGFGFIQSLRTRGLHQPIVAVTALTSARDHEACFQSGANYVLQKPFRITTLSNLIRDIDVSVK